MNIGAFTILSCLAGDGDSGMELENVSGLATQRPWLALALTAFLFSMAGIPPMGGFFAKYVLFYSGVQVGAVWLVVLGVLCSAVSVYYYLRVIVYMYMRPVARSSGGTVAVPLTLQVVIGITLAAVVLFGVLPNALLQVVRSLFA